jgi:hypothetical protein
VITKGGDTPSSDQDRFATIEAVPVPSARLKTSIAGHLDFHASQRWPQLEEVTIGWRGGYGYVTAHLPGDELPLCRLRYLGSDTEWGFALYRASSERYDDTPLPDGSPSGTPEQALDCALGLYLADPSAWINPPKDQSGAALGCRAVLRQLDTTRPHTRVNLNETALQTALDELSGERQALTRNLLGAPDPPRP